MAVGVDLAVAHVEQRGVPRARPRALGQRRPGRNGPRLIATMVCRLGGLGTRSRFASVDERRLAL